jgi:hypothetical protein
MLRVIDEQLIELLGEEKARLPFIDPNPQTGRTYPDGEPIPDSLPAAYQLATNPDVPPGQNCGNCEYYRPGELYCTKFDAPVRAVFWCAKWEESEEDYAVTGQAHPSLENLSQADRLMHLQEMLMEGYSNEEILALHPEITLQDIIDAGAAAAAAN